MQSACSGIHIASTILRLQCRTLRGGLQPLMWLLAACIMGAASPADADLSCGFIQNPGLWGDSVQYLVNGDRTSIYFTAEAVIVDLKDPGSAATVNGSAVAGQLDPNPLQGKSSAAAEVVHRFAVWVSFSGANRQPILEAEGELPTRFHYYLGGDPELWRSEVPIFTSIRYRDLWPGIDLVYSLESGRLSYALECRPGADPAQARFEYDGATRVTMLEEAVYQIETPIGNFTDERPVAARGSTGRMLFPSTGPAGPREGDPRPSWSTLLGGGASYEKVQLACDAGGQILVASSTLSSYLPAVPGPHAYAYDGRSVIFISKLDQHAENLLWTAFIGGERGDVVHASAVDRLGNLILTGRTSSTAFPFTTLPAGELPEAQSRAFVAKLDAGGNLAWCLDLGPGSGEAITTDVNGHAFVAGRAVASSFAATEGALGNSLGDGERGYDAFIAKVHHAGTGVLWSALLGGARNDGACAVALDGLGNPIITGGTYSADFPVSAGAYGQYYNGKRDFFVAKVDAAQKILLWSTIIGGDDLDFSTALAVTEDDDIVLTGYTNSRNYPTTSQSFAPDPDTLDGPTVSGDAFVTKLTASGEHLEWSVRLGGKNHEVGWAVAIDQEGRHLIAGMTDSPDFPCRAASHAAPTLGYADVFVTKLDAHGRQIVAGSVLGGSGMDMTHSLVLDASGSPVIGGLTKSRDFPTTAGSFDATSNGTSDVFIARIELVDGLPGEEGGETPTPRAFLLQNYPNPFNPMTSIDYELPDAREVSLSIFDVSGRSVRILRDRVHQNAGLHRVVWDGRDETGKFLPSGMYIYRLDAGRHHEAKSMILVK